MGMKQSCLWGSKPKTPPSQRAHKGRSAEKRACRHQHDTADTAVHQAEQSREQAYYSDPEPPPPLPLLSLPPHLISSHILPRVSSISLRAFLGSCKAVHSLRSMYLADWLQQQRPASALHLAAGLEGAGNEQLLLELLNRPGLLAASEQLEASMPLLFMESRAGFRVAESRLLQLGKGVQACHCRDLPDLAAALDAARDQRQATIIDLCGRELKGTLTADLLVPAYCTVRSGSIHLPHNSMVRFAEGAACLQSLLITGSLDTQPEFYCTVEVSNSSCVHMRDCFVGGERSVSAVAVLGNGSKLMAARSSMHNSIKCGLVVDRGGHVLLEGCRADGNGHTGWAVFGNGSYLSARDSSASRNRRNNVSVFKVISFEEASVVEITQCVLDWSMQSGLFACEIDGSVTASATSICSNGGVSNVYAGNGSTVKLSGCRCDSSRGFGWSADDKGTTITVDAACTADDNVKGSIEEHDGGRVVQPHVQPSAPSGTCCVS